MIFFTDINNRRVDLIVWEGKTDTSGNELIKYRIEEEMSDISIDKVALSHVTLDNL